MGGPPPPYVHSGGTTTHNISQQQHHHYHHRYDHQQPIESNNNRSCHRSRSRTSRKPENNNSNDLKKSRVVYISREDQGNKKKREHSSQSNESPKELKNQHHDGTNVITKNLLEEASISDHILEPHDDHHYHHHHHHQLEGQKKRRRKDLTGTTTSKTDYTLSNTPTTTTTTESLLRTHDSSEYNTLRNRRRIIEKDSTVMNGSMQTLLHSKTKTESKLQQQSPTSSSSSSSSYDPSSITSKKQRSNSELNHDNQYIRSITTTTTTTHHEKQQSSSSSSHRRIDYTTKHLSPNKQQIASNNNNHSHHVDIIEDNQYSSHVSSTTNLLHLSFVSDPPPYSEIPPSPLNLPSTIAQLRVLLLVGLISSKIETTTTTTTTDLPRFFFSCPIHSMVLTRVLKHYFKLSRHVPSWALLPFRSDIIATELHHLAQHIIDPIAGECEPLILLDTNLNDNEVIIESFDFVRCDNLIRIALRRDHPSLARNMWNPKTPTYYMNLTSGIGLGIIDNTTTTTVIIPPVSKVNHNNNKDMLSLENENKSITGDIIIKDNLKSLGKSNVSSSSLLEYPSSSTTTNHLSTLGFNVPTTTTTGLKTGMMPILSSLGKNVRNNNNNLSNTTTTTHPISFQHPHLTSLNKSIGAPPPRSITNEFVEILNDNVNLEELLNAPSAKEQQAIDSGAELRDLLAAPTAKHSITTRTFQSRGGSRVQQICRHGTRHECLQAAVAEFEQKRIHQNPGDPNPPAPNVCPMIHFRRILLPHTDLSLGDCSYLDTCRHMATCRFVHYEVDLDTGTEEQRSELLERMGGTDSLLTHNIGTVASTQMEELPAQWITCDVRKFDWTTFRGKVKIVMADPPWDIHMDLPYGTMTDAEMKALRLDLVQDEGCLFLWVTGRAMELGRECMKLWGYKQIEEIVWLKTNQLHRIIRTGRTGHWLNHSKEHCLVGIKGQPKLNRNIDTDIIVAEVRETSRKPDEIYRIIERLSPGPYKLELFGRPHNVRNNWITLGNQLDNIRLHDELLIQRYNAFAESTGMPSYDPTELDNETDQAHK